MSYSSRSGKIPISCFSLYFLLVGFQPAWSQQERSPRPLSGSQQIDKRTDQNNASQSVQQDARDGLKNRRDALQQNANRVEASAQLTDSDRAALLAVKFQVAANLNDFAAQQFENQELRSFAEQTANQLQKTVEQLQQNTSQSNPDAGDSASSDEPDLSETVEDIGHVVQDRLEKRAEVSSTNQNGAAESSPDREPANRDRKDTWRDNRQRLEARARERGTSSAGDRVRVLLPALREELPELVSLIAEAIETDGSQNSAWLREETLVLERTLQAKKDELSKYHGEEFDQAYLGMLLVTCLELNATTEVVSQQADRQLEQVLERVPQELTNIMRNARKKMEDQQRGIVQSRSSDKRSLSPR